MVYCETLNEKGIASPMRMQLILNTFVYRIMILVCVCLSPTVSSQNPPSAPSDTIASGEGTISGRVVGQDESGLPYANVKVVGHPYGEMTDLDGRFTIVVPTGQYRLEASMIGFRKGFETVVVDPGGMANVTLRLEEQMLSLSAITVTPGRFSMMGNDPVTQQTLTREDIESIPQIGEDVYRAVTRLPGISGNDFSAKFTVRGGEHEEVLVTLDGLEIFDPFHLKDVNGGALSIVDVKAIGGIDLMTGGFSSQYGGHLSGVFKISSIDPQPKPQTSVGISFMNARVMNEGQFNDGDGSWLVSARRGYLDLVLSLMNEEGVDPRYYDALGKVTFRLNDNHTLSTHVLRAGDDLTAREDEDWAQTKYDNSYAWQRLQSTFGARTTAETVWSFSRSTHRREGADLVDFRPNTPEEVVWHVVDERSFNVFGLKQDWQHDAGSHFLSWGFDAKWLDAEYDYFNRERFFFQNTPGVVESDYDTTRIETAPDGSEVGVYASDRFRLAPRVTAEVGLRYDRVSYTDDGDWSPRSSLVFSPTKRTAIRAGWGLYHQSQGIHEMDVAYGDQVFYRSERSEHRVVGVEHVFAQGTQLRVEGYQKKRSHVRPRWENQSKDVLFFPELEARRLFLQPESAASKGIEVYLKRDLGKKLSFWGSYAVAWAEESIEGRDVAKNADQRHTVYVDANYRPNAKWRINAAWSFRTGWPYSEEFFVRTTGPGGRQQIRQQYGELNAKRFPAYHRLDLRVNRVFDTGRGRFSVFLEVVNLYNRTNLRLIEADSWGIDDSGDVFVVSEFTEKWFPLLPSVGASWTF